MKTSDMKFEIDVSLEDLIYGNDKTINYKKNIICDVCMFNNINGKLNQNVINNKLNQNVINNKVNLCEYCNGQGINIEYKQNFVLCLHCNGLGYLDKERNKREIKHNCIKCNDNGIFNRLVSLTFQIPRGKKHSDVIIISEEANQQPCMIPGDVIVKINVVPHLKFETLFDYGNDKCYDLVCNYNIDSLIDTNIGDDKNNDIKRIVNSSACNDIKEIINSSACNEIKIKINTIDNQFITFETRFDNINTLKNKLVPIGNYGLWKNDDREIIKDDKYNTDDKGDECNDYNQDNKDNRNTKKTNSRGMLYLRIISAI